MQMVESADYYNRGKGIKRPELLNVYESKLEGAVIGWIWGKFDDDGSNQDDVIASLPESCRYVYSCFIVNAEVMNGGLNQLFYNTGKQFADMSINGFALMGSNELSDVMKEAVKRYEANKSDLEKYNDGALESFMESYYEAIFDDLDNIFGKEADKVDSAEYIKANIKDFGDE